MRKKKPRIARLDQVIISRDADDAIKYIEGDLVTTMYVQISGMPVHLAVPEPSTLVGLLGLCLAGLLPTARRARALHH